MTTKVFVLTQRILNIFRRKGLIKCCRECGRSFEIGDVIVSKYGGSAKAKWYCKKHARKFGII
jgi:hypothetical protein